MPIPRYVWGRDAIEASAARDAARRAAEPARPSGSSVLSRCAACGHWGTGQRTHCPACGLPWETRPNVGPAPVREG